MSLEDLINTKNIMAAMPEMLEEKASTLASSLLRSARFFLNKEMDIIPVLPKAVTIGSISALKREYYYGKNTERFRLPEPISVSGSIYDQGVALKQGANEPTIFSLSFSKLVTQFQTHGTGLDKNGDLWKTIHGLHGTLRAFKNQNISVMRGQSLKNHPEFNIVPILDTGEIAFYPPYFPRKAQVAPYELNASFWFRALRCLGKNVNVLVTGNETKTILIRNQYMMFVVPMSKEPNA